MNFKEMRDYWKNEIGAHYVTNPQYYLEIGYECYSNFDVTRDQGYAELAFIYFKQGANLGSDEALYYTALCYFEGTGVERNYKRSEKFLNQVKGYEKFVEDLQSKLNSKKEDRASSLLKLRQRGFNSVADSSDGTASGSEEVSTSISMSESSESSYSSSGHSSFDSADSDSREPAVPVNIPAARRQGSNFLRRDRRANCNSAVKSL